MAHLRRFDFDEIEPAGLRVGDVITQSAGRWKIIERLENFSVFTLKNCLSGETIMAVGRPESHGRWCLREVRSPDFRNMHVRAERERRKALAKPLLLAA